MFGAIRLSSLRLLGECVPSLEEKVTQIVVDQLGVEASEVSPKSSFVEDLGADSLDRVELVMALEEAFAVEITDEQAEKIATVQDAVDYIQKNAKSVKHKTSSTIKPAATDAAANTNTSIREAK